MAKKKTDSLLEKVKAIKARIDKDSKGIEKEIDDKEKYVEQLSKSGISETKEKIAKEEILELKNMLKHRYLKNSEFRAAFIDYVEAIGKEKSEEQDAIRDTIEDKEAQIDIIKLEVEDLRIAQKDIIFSLLDKISDIDMDFYHEFGDCFSGGYGVYNDFEFIKRKILDKVKKYE